MPRPTKKNSTAIPVHDLVAYRLNALTNAILRSGTRHYAATARISAPEVWVLGAIGNFAPITAREVAGRMAIDEAQVSRAIKSLLKRKLIHRRASSEDKRRKILTLSEQGQHTFGIAMGIAADRQTALLKGFSAGEIDRLVEMLGRLSANAEKMFVD